MSQYTTGEMAKLCDVSVRTVQYYDARGILAPSAFSEGGRRLYGDDDLRKLRIICFLREIGFSIDNIGTLFSEESQEKVITMLIERREEEVSRELDELQKRLSQLAAVRRALKSIGHVSVDSLGDIAHIVKNRKKRRRMLGGMLFVGLLMDCIEVGTIVYGARTGVWLPLLVGLPVVIAMGVMISRYYFQHTAYVCPDCHNVFRPTFWDAFWAPHTPSTRRVTCTKCGRHGFCVETYTKEDPECFKSTT